MGDKKTYKLCIKISSKDIEFKLRNAKYISYIFYIKKYKYEDILKDLNLGKNYILIKILELFDFSIKNKKVFINEDENNNKNLYLIKEENSKQKKYCINLEEEIISDNSPLWKSRKNTKILI